MGINETDIPFLVEEEKKIRNAIQASYLNIKEVSTEIVSIYV